MKGNRAKLAAPPTEDIAVALPLIRINQVETMVVATNPNEPCPMVLSKAYPTNNFHRESTPLIQKVARNIIKHRVVSVFRAPNLSRALPAATIKIAAVMDPAVYRLENVVRDHPRSSII